MIIENLLLKISHKKRKTTGMVFHVRNFANIYKGKIIIA